MAIRTATAAWKRGLRERTGAFSGASALQTRPAQPDRMSETLSGRPDLRMDGHGAAHDLSPARAVDVGRPAPEGGGGPFRSRPQATARRADSESSRRANRAAA